MNPINFHGPGNAPAGEYRPADSGVGGNARRWRPPGPPSRWALFLDVDGTLIDLAPRPDLIRPPGGLVPLIRRLRRQLGGALAVVTGRALADVDRILGDPTIPGAGQHGAELRLPGGRRRDAQIPAALAAARAAIRAEGFAPAPLLVEDKGATIAIHYRAAPRHAPALRRALAALVPAGGPLALLAGHALFELKPRAVGKHAAVAALMAVAPFRGRLPIFVGDDVTDRDGFAEVERRGGYAVHVRPLQHGSRNPNLFLRSPSEVRAWLRFLLWRRPGEDEDEPCP